MFTGIISAIGEIMESTQQGDLRIAIACPWDDLAIGESVAVNGVCLTVVNKKGVFDLSAETLTRTAPRWNVGDAVNLERALKMGDVLSGHMVTGHVDGTAKIISITPRPVGGRLGGGPICTVLASSPPPLPSPYGGGSTILHLESPPALGKFIAEKGSVTLDGVSLTVNKVDGARFWVNIIPHTWQHTTLHLRKSGDMLNLEIDMIARYVAHLLAR